MGVRGISWTVAAAAAAGLAAAYYLRADPRGPGAEPASTRSAPAAPAAAAQSSEQLLARLRDVLDAYRRIVVLLADDKKLAAQERDAANRVGHALFHDNQARIASVEENFGLLLASRDPARFAQLEPPLSYIESGAGLFDADRLAFRDIVLGMQKAVAADGSLPAIKLHKRLSEDLDALAEIERNYDKELRQIFSRFEARAIELKRERWEDYLAHLRGLYTREAILKDQGVILPYPMPKEPEVPATKAEKGEIYGYGLPPMTVALSFDDGPHAVYTDEIVAILKQYAVPAVFFEVGRNLGSVDAEGKAKLGPRAEVSRRVQRAGFALANHSYTHSQLSKQKGDPLKAEIANTDALLRAVDGGRAPLFRFPYGDRNKEGLEALTALKLRSVMWNIDSLDWADPVPRSIADRVLRVVNNEQRGIVLFHDIHERTVKALPLILDRLVAEGYRFAAWDGSGFTVPKAQAARVEKVAISTAYGNSWAVVIGIDDYVKWPRLQYAVRDAQAVRQTLIERFAFPAERVLMLKNEEATRANILALFHEKFAHGGLKRDDRVFVFFAGHGATRRLSSGRDLGYIVPVDSDPERFATDAIPMTELQNISEALTAKHILFVMDACYSGLGLTRGGASSSNFLRDNARRVGRQMLTAGGTDQLVADGGPNGHSVFTWTLLQGLAGKGDLNGDGLITATELAAYLAPAVAGVSRQTPAFGSLPGSEGGEFVLELAAKAEFITEQTEQLPADAIALNTRLDQSRPSGSTPVTVKDLSGGERQLELPKPVSVPARHLAQQANDAGLRSYREKRYEAAAGQFTEALKHQPDFAEAANNLGFIYYKQGRHSEAVRWFDNTLKMDPSRSVAYVNLADALFELGEKAKAKRAYQNYLALAPNGGRAAHAKKQIDKL